ncbi:MAG: hypothetical protein KDC58_09935 [Cyclobacteriaceae bacterium]|nr:hypothetical protein [Cyclobacteriaceae bacterium]
MKSLTNILIPIAFLLLAGFNFYVKNWMEATLYIMVGGGFTLLNLIRSKAIMKNLKFWNALSWALVILSIIMFLLVLLQDANKEILILQPII